LYNYINDLLRISYTFVLPVPVAPTNITPCLTIIVSINYIILTMKLGGFYKCSKPKLFYIALSKSGYSFLGTFTPGNKSDIIPKNNGKS